MIRLLAAALLPFTGPVLGQSWDGRGKTVMPVFVAPPLADAALTAAVEGFLTDLMVKGDAAAAEARATTLFDDACLGAPPDRGDELDAYYETCFKSPAPIDAAERATRRRRELAKHVRFADGRLRTLDGLYDRLSPEAQYAAGLARAADGARLERFGGRFLVQRPGRAAHLEIVVPTWAAERYFAAARRGGFELRMVMALFKEDSASPHMRVIQYMLWAREPSGWKLWDARWVAGASPDTKPRR